MAWSSLLVQLAEYAKALLVEHLKYECSTNTVKIGTFKQACLLRTYQLTRSPKMYHQLMRVNLSKVKFLTDFVLKSGTVV